MKCAVMKCNNRNYGKAYTRSFFRFPTDNTLRKKWVAFCGGIKFNKNSSVVCMHHFKAEDFSNKLQYEMGFATRRLLKDGAVPSINTTDINNSELHQQRARRIERRENRKTVSWLLENHSDNLIPSKDTDILQPIENIDIKMEDIDKIEDQQPELQSQQNYILQPIINTYPAIEYIDIKTENIDEIEKYQSKLQSKLNNVLQPIQNTDPSIKYIDIKTEKIDEIKKEQPVKQITKILSLERSGFHNVNKKSETLRNGIFVPSKEQGTNYAALKNIHTKIEKMDNIHKYGNKEMERYLAETNLEHVGEKRQEPTYGWIIITSGLKLSLVDVIPCEQ